MTLDSSALLAILQDEPEKEEFIAHIEDATRVLVSAATVLETSMVLEGRRGIGAGLDLDQFLRKASVQVEPFDEDQLEVARSAFRRYGKGHHGAALNFGDCISYALAKCSGEPLLFKGDDFAATDVVSARRTR